jgi:hypothetical protein
MVRQGLRALISSVFHQDCHFEIFRNIRREYLTELATTENVAAQDHSEGTLISDYDPVRPAISDPVAVEAPYLGDSGANVITDPVTQLFASCFRLDLHAHAQNAPVRIRQRHR